MDRGHSPRQQAAGEHPFTDIGQGILFAIFLVVWIADSFLLRYSVIHMVPVAGFIRCAIGGLILTASAVFVLKAHKAVFPASGGKAGLIVEGVFSLVRHPMYFGSWLFSLALVLMTFSVSAAIISFVILLFYIAVARYEERLLMDKFGAAYRRYQSRVPMLFPVRGRGTRRSLSDPRKPAPPRKPPAARRPPLGGTAGSRCPPGPLASE